jgi:hypothetical protein
MTAATFVTEKIVDALERCGCRPKRTPAGGWSARCPAHDDRDPSLSVSEGANGKALVYCHAGCTIDAVLVELGLTTADLFADEPTIRESKRVVASYTYIDEQGEVLYRVDRRSDKSFEQRPASGKRGAGAMQGVRLVLYRLPQVIAAVADNDVVYIVEGEKDADAIVKAGGIATCNPMGAGKWSRVADHAREVLAGAFVVVVADKDKPGYAHAAEVAASLGDVVASLFVVEACEGKDAADHLASGHTLEELLFVEDADLGAADRVHVHDDVVVVQREWPKLDPAALYGLADEIVRAIEPESEADPAALLFLTLGYWGAHVGARPHATADGSKHPPRLNVVVVGETSQGRKGTAHANIKNLWEIADEEFVRRRVLNGFGSGESLVDHVTPQEDQIYDERLIVREGEFARLLKVAKRDGSTLSPIIRAAWDGERLAVRSRAKTSVADGAHVVVIADITPEELNRCLTETEQLNGWANRFLYVCSRRSKLLPEGGSLDDGLLGDLGCRLRDAAEIARGIGTMRRSDAGKTAWADLYHDLDADRPGGLLGAVTGRAAAQCLRLSVAYATLDGSHTIEAWHVDAARAAWAYCRASAEFIFGDAVGDEIADRLLAAVRRAGPDGLDLTAIRDVFNKHKSADVGRARQLLLKRELVTEHEEPTAGRPRTVLRAATKATEATEAR